MPSIIRAYATSRYGQIHYRIARPDGHVTAPPLLCLHQTPSSSKDWEPVMPVLGRTRVVIAADTPGYGMSDSPPAPVGIEDFAQVMAQLMSDLAADGIAPAGPFDVMGYHTGSLVATEMARSFPAQVRRLVLFGLAAYSAEIRADKLARLRDNFPVPDDSLHHVEKLWAIVSCLSDPRLTAEERHIGMAECLRLGSRMPWGYVSVYHYDFLEALAAVDKDTLVFNPQDDLWTVTSEAAHLLRKGRRYDMPGVSHGVLTLERDRVVAEIERYLA